MPEIVDWLASKSVNSEGDYVGVGQPGFFESLIPFWGSGRAAFDDAQNGRWTSMTINATFFALDALMVGSLLKGGYKLVGQVIRQGGAADLRSLLARARNAVPWQYGNTGGALGSTDRFGNVTIRRGLTGQVLDETVRHESVHRFLSPRSGPFQNLRASVMERGYENSHLLRYLEEAMAESFATGSLRKGLAFPLQGGYRLSVTRTAVEGGGYALVVGGSSYGAYKLSEELNK